MSTKTFTTPFREFITRDDQGRYHVRLGPQTFSTNHAFTDIRIEKHSGSEVVSSDLLDSKPWILKNLQQEVNFQRKKEKAMMFSQECFQRPRYSANERIAYKNARHNA